MEVTVHKRHLIAEILSDIEVCIDIKILLSG